IPLEEVNVLPPIRKRQPGRTRKQRRIDAFEAEMTGKRRNEKRCRRCGEFGHNSTGCQNEPEQDKDQTMPVVPNKGGRPKIRPERVVWDPETGRTKVLPNKGAGTGVTAKERAEMLKGAKMAKAAKQASASGNGGNEGGRRGRGRVVGNGNDGNAGNEGGGRGRGRAVGNGNDGNEGGGNAGNEGGGRERGRAVGNGNGGNEGGGNGNGNGGNEGGGRGRGRGNGNGGRGGDPVVSQPTKPSTPPPMEDVTPQSQLTQPTQTEFYCRAPTHNPSRYFRVPDQRNPPQRSSTRLASMFAELEKKVYQGDQASGSKN
ncbi:hypothetical protein FRX31_032422, partial [Thalictrum thalictroides]